MRGGRDVPAPGVLKLRSHFVRSGRVGGLSLTRYVADVSAAGEEQPRFLHRHVARNYTSTPYLAARYEPEAVSEAEQREQTARAHRSWQQEQRRAWGKAHANIRRALDEFAHSGPVDRGVLDAAKGVERAAQRVDRRVGLA
jgi:hypothetical protein